MRCVWPNPRERTVHVDKVRVMGGSLERILAELGRELDALTARVDALELAAGRDAPPFHATEVYADRCSVACPYCGAVAGSMCAKVRGPDAGKRADVVHGARVRLANTMAVRRASS